MLFNMGVNTGRTSGRLAALNYETTFNCGTYDGGHGVYTWCDFGQGDSGGPTFFYLNPTTVYMISVTQNRYWDHRTGCRGGKVGADSCGTGAYRLNNRYGITFGDGLGW